MEKKFIYIGILMLVLFAVVLLVAVPDALGISFGKTAFAIAPGHDAYTTASANATYFSEAVYNSTENLDFYVANATAFSTLLPYVSLNESLMNASLALEGNGMLEILNNSHIGSFPAANSSQVLYSNYNAISAIAEPYYIIFQNAGNATANVIMVVSRIRNPTSDVVGFASLGAIMLAFLLLGIGLIAYGIFKKPKTPEKDVVSKDEVDAIYKKIEDKGKK